MTPTTKPGKHGLLYLYAYTYRSACDPGAVFSARAWRYSLEHIWDAFIESNDGDDWELIQAQCVPTEGIVASAPVHRF